MKLIFWGEYVIKLMKLFWGNMSLSHDYIFGGICVNPILTYLPTDPIMKLIFFGGNMRQPHGTVLWGNMRQPYEILYFRGDMRQPHSYLLTHLPHETYILGGICVNPILTYLSHVGEYTSTPIYLYLRVNKCRPLTYLLTHLPHETYIFGGICVNPVHLYLRGICVNPILTYLTHVGEYASTPRYLYF